MNNETETEWENVTYDNTNTSNTTQNTTDSQNSVEQNITTELIVNLDESEQLQQIHDDLSIIVCFIIFFVLVILLKYSYRFFNMFFPM